MNHCPTCTCTWDEPEDEQPVVYRWRHVPKCNAGCSGDVHVNAAGGPIELVVEREWPVTAHAIPDNRGG